MSHAAFATHTAVLHTMTSAVVLLQPVVRKQHNSGFKHKASASVTVEVMCTSLMCQLVERCAKHSADADLMLAG